MFYCIGDVHGCYDEMVKLVNKIQASDPDAQILFLGDLIDRGKDVLKVLRYMMEHITSDGPFQCIRGNHEQEAIEYIEDDLLVWLRQGGFSSGKKLPESNYDFSLWLDAGGLINETDLCSIRDFFLSLPLSKTVTLNSVTYKIGHAWYPEETDLSPEEEIFAKLFSRENENKEENTIVIHGHVPTIYGDYSAPGMIGYRHQEINLDSGCCYGQSKLIPFPCPLAAICLDTLEEIYSDTIAERFSMKNRELSYEDALLMQEQYIQEYMTAENPYRIEMKKMLSINC